MNNKGKKNNDERVILRDRKSLVEEIPFKLEFKR